ncbi:MAG: hypothetical protein AB7G93_11830 [Bdellovibrionales bacterium]
MPIHKDLPDSELHPPKGFIPASNESFPIKNASGLLEWISTSNLGSKWHTGAGVPAPALGRTGDFYLDSDVGDFYEKTNFNTWTLRGNVDGSDWFKGSGPPSPALGRIQDFYIDIDEGDLYEKTAPTVWDLITNIDGSDWFQGAGPPAPALGREQDFYIDKITGDLYEKNSPTTWNLFANITGPQGPVGPMANVSDDTTPELGGNLNGQGHSISNVSTYNDVTVEAHAARHAPSGADALPLGGPVNIGAINAPGTANSYPRSDHQHAHANQPGGSLHALVTQVLSGFMSASDKLKIDQLNIGHLSYSNSAIITTNSVTFINVSLDADRESFANGLLTKLNSTDFQTNFAGQVAITYRASCFPATNDQGWEIGIQRNSSDISWAALGSNAKNNSNRRDTPSGSVILNCTMSDVFRLRLRSLEGSTITVNPDFAYMSIRVYRISP